MDGVDVLIFWYRNEIFAIEARCGTARHEHPLSSCCKFLHCYEDFSQDHARSRKITSAVPVLASQLKHRKHRCRHCELGFI